MKRKNDQVMTPGDGNKKTRPDRLLLLEDNRYDAELMEHALRKGEVSVEIVRVSSREEYVGQLKNSPDIILSDYSLPGFSAPEALDLAKEFAPGVPFIIVTGAVPEETAADVIGIGATDYVLKDHLTRLPHAVNDALMMRRLSREKKEAEKRFEWSEVQYRTVFNSVQTGILIIDPADHRIVDINPALAALIGLSKEEIIGQVCHRFICPAEEGRCPVTDLHQVVDDSERVLITGHGGHVPVRKIVADFDFEGKQYLIESIVDVTEQKKSQEKKEELLESCNNAIFSLEKDIASLMMEKERVFQEKERYKSLTAGISGIHLSVSMKGAILSARSPTGEVFGHREGDLTGSPVTTLIPEQDREPFNRVLSRARAGDTKPSDIRVITKTGGIRQARLAIRPVLEDGDCTHLSVIIADLSEWVTAQEEQKKLHKSLMSLFEGLPLPVLEIQLNDPRTGDQKILSESPEILKKNELGKEVQAARGNPVMQEFLWQHFVGTPMAFLLDPAQSELQKQVIASIKDGITRTGFLSLTSSKGQISRAKSVIIPGGPVVYLVLVPESLRLGAEMDKEIHFMSFVFSALPMAVMLTNVPGMITLANESAAQLFGYDKKSDLTGMGIGDLVSPPDRPRIAEHVRDSFQGIGRVIEYLCQQKDGSLFSAKVETHPITLDGQTNGSLLYIFPVPHSD